MSFPPPSLPPRKVPVRRHVKPARGAKAASLALSAVSTLGLAALFAKQDEASSSAAPSPTLAPSLAPSSTVAFETEPAVTPTTLGSTTSPSTTSDIADGVFVGAADTNRWGTVQVQIVVSNGVLTDVQVLSSPDSDRKSVRINERALPTLTAEALAAENADIDSVSGATYTWQSYTISLQSALDAASSAV